MEETDQNREDPRIEITKTLITLLNKIEEGSAHENIIRFLKDTETKVDPEILRSAVTDAIEVYYSEKGWKPIESAIPSLESCIHLYLKKGTDEKCEEKWVKAAWNSESCEAVRSNIEYYNQLIFLGFEDFQPLEETKQPNSFLIEMAYAGEDYDHLALIYHKNSEYLDVILDSLLIFLGINPNETDEKYNNIKPQNSLLDTIQTKEYHPKIEYFEGAAQKYLKFILEHCLYYIETIDTFSDLDEHEKEELRKIESKVLAYKANLEQICGLNTPVTIANFDSNIKNKVLEYKISAKGGVFTKAKKEFKPIRTRILDQPYHPNLIFGPLPFVWGCIHQDVDDRNLSPERKSYLRSQLRKHISEQHKEPTSNKHIYCLLSSPDEVCDLEAIFNIGVIYKQLQSHRFIKRRYGNIFKIKSISDIHQKDPNKPFLNRYRFFSSKKNQ